MSDTVAWLPVLFEGRALADGRRIARLSRSAAVISGLFACATFLPSGSVQAAVGMAGIVLVAPAAWVGALRPGGGRGPLATGLPLFTALAACGALAAGVEPRSVAAGAAVALLLHQAATGWGSPGDRRLILSSTIVACLGAACNATPFVGVCLGAFVAAAAIGLTAATLAGPGSRAGRLARPRVLALPLGLALAVPCLAVLLFPVLPRQPGRAADLPVRLVHLSGFDDVVHLGALGPTLADPSPVFRVRVEDAAGHPLPGPFLFRALALDAFDGRTWRRVGRDPAPASSGPTSAPLVQQVLLEPLVPTVLPVLHRALAVDAGSGPVKRDSSGSWTWAAAPRRLAYRAWSTPPETGPADDPATDVHLEIPVGLDPAVIDLAHAVAGGEQDRRTRAEALATWLEASCTWTPVPEPLPPDRAVEAFLLESRRGHCEMFASGLVLLLRAQQIPARLVLGFRGGRWNALAGWWEVRHADAHAWAEVDLGGGRWIPVDATPGGATFDRSRAGSAAVDWARVRWSAGLLDFTAQDQQRTLSHAGAALREAVTPSSGPDEILPDGFLALAAALPILALLLLGLGAAARYLAGEGTRRPSPEGEVDRSWHRARRWVLRRGWPLPDWLPPLAAADWLATRIGPVAAPFQVLARLRYAVLYAGEPDARLAPEAARALAALRSIPRPRTRRPG